MGYSCRCEEVEKSSKTSVEYVEFGEEVEEDRLAAEVTKVIEDARSQELKTIIVYVDTSYIHRIDVIKRCFTPHQDLVIVKFLFIQPKEDENKKWHERINRFNSVSFEIQDGTQATENQPAVLVFLGNPEGFVLNQILLQQALLGIKLVITPECKGNLYPLKKLSSPLGNDTFMKRYLMIEKAKKCSVFGIIVVNSWVHKGGKTAVKNMLDLLKRHEKKGYVFTMST